MKIFPNESFGYMRVNVERPLRLRWEISEETIATLKASKVYERLCRDGWSDVEPGITREAFDRWAQHLMDSTFTTLGDAETAFAVAAVATWEDMGWESTWKAASRRCSGVRQVL